MTMTDFSNFLQHKLEVLKKNERNKEREEMFSIIEDIFSPSGSFKGRIYFTDADDLIRELKLRLKEKDNNGKN